LSGVGPAPGMSGNDEIVPALDERTRQLIVSLVETGIESALATRATSLAGNDAAVAARNPSPTSASAAPGRDPSTLGAGAGAANLRGGSGGPGITEDPARAPEDEDKAEDTRDEDE
jgi:hypothetical protein